MNDESQIPTQTLGSPADLRDLPLESYGPGTRIGSYVIEERLGSGGMGTVFSARRTDDAYAVRVAIKVANRKWASPEERSRFRRERQILASLRDPAIAGLLDGGTHTDGRSYLVMEFVEGRPLDRYLREEQPPLKDRLDLFAHICAAVQFAHRNLIVHRDLKPANILVTPEGRIKLLDFGIAKILEGSDFGLTVEETRPGRSPMTIAYAGPEQVNGEPITPATDVYALGILLYEMLTGRHPYPVEGRSLSAMLDAVCLHEPVAPSERLRLDYVSDRETGVPWQTLPRDLDAVTLKALAKDPAERYPSAEQLAEDLRRFQQHLPVRARRGTRLYRAQKFLYRYRVPLSILAVVAAGLVESILLLVEDRRRLEDQVRQTEAVAAWMSGVYDPAASVDSEASLRELLDERVRAARRDLAHEPEALSRALFLVGSAYARLDLCDEAVPLLREVLRHESTPDDRRAQALDRLRRCESN